MSRSADGQGAQAAAEAGLQLADEGVAAEWAAGHRGAAKTPVAWGPYAGFGRLTLDRMSNGEDGEPAGPSGSVFLSTVRRIERQYDQLGRVIRVTSKDDADAGNVVNEVRYAHGTDHWSGQAMTVSSYHDHGDTAASGDPAVTYTYEDGTGAEDYVAESFRLASLAYLGAGRVVEYDYGTAGEMDDLLACVTAIQEKQVTVPIYRPGSSPGGGPI